MSALGPYMPWIAWAFVPPFATQFTLEMLYNSRALPRPSSKEIAMRHSARTRALLVGGYLFYTFYSALNEAEPSAYRLLDVELDSSPEKVRRAFRQLSKVYHPDKVGVQGESFFIALRRSHDVLIDPVKRFAYDRFGIGVLSWKDALSYREHMAIGIRDTLLFYLINPLIFVVISWFGKDRSPFSFWHFTLLLLCFSTELYLVSSPFRPSIVRKLLPHRTTREIAVMLHQIYTSSTMAMRQLLPFLPGAQESPLTAGPKTLKDAEAFIAQLAVQLETLGGKSVAMMQRSEETLRHDLEPLAPAAMSTAATLQEAAAAASAAASPSPMSTLTDPYDSSQSTRLPAATSKLSRLQEAYAHLTGRELIRRELASSQEMRSIIEAKKTAQVVVPASTSTGLAVEVGKRGIAEQGQSNVHFRSTEFENSRHNDDDKDNDIVLVTAPQVPADSSSSEGPAAAAGGGGGGGGGGRRIE